MTFILIGCRSLSSIWIMVTRDLILEHNDIFSKLFVRIKHNKLRCLRFYIDIYLGLINFTVYKFWGIGLTFR
jgi:hypothetical protein